MEGSSRFIRSLKGSFLVLIRWFHDILHLPYFQIGEYIVFIYENCMLTAKNGPITLSPAKKFNILLLNQPIVIEN